jgi:hypothetical protein
VIPSKSQRIWITFAKVQIREKKISIIMRSLLKIAADGTVRAELSEINHYVDALGDYRIICLPKIGGPSAARLVKKSLRCIESCNSREVRNY